MWTPRGESLMMQCTKSPSMFSSRQVGGYSQEHCLSQEFRVSVRISNARSLAKGDTVQVF